jgi:hypothetical protein
MLPRPLCAVLLTGLLCVGLTSAAGRPPRASDGLVVHEWGTFTSVVGHEGIPVSWRPAEQKSDLPSFVHTRTRNGKSRIVGTVRMETPVLYFYSERQTRVSVSVNFPRGVLTEWYPSADSDHKELTWKDVDVRPGAPERFPVEEGASHYYAARATDAAPLRVNYKDAKPQHEKMLFYRGVGTFDLPLRVVLDDRSIRIMAEDGGPVRVMVVESRGGNVVFQDARLVAGATTLERQEPTENRTAELRQAFAAVLTAEGLYPREAQAMIDTWADTWTEDGLRVFFVVPHSTTDALLPLRITPAPESLVRVLVGRIEIIRPETEAEATAIALRLDSFDTRAAARESLSALGHFHEPIVRYLGAKQGPAASLLKEHLPEYFRDF